ALHPRDHGIEQRIERVEVPKNRARAQTHLLGEAASAERGDPARPNDVQGGVSQLGLALLRGATGLREHALESKCLLAAVKPVSTGRSDTRKVFALSGWGARMVEAVRARSAPEAVGQLLPSALLQHAEAKATGSQRTARPGTLWKCASRVYTASPCSTAMAAIQRSLVGIGMPRARSALWIRA